MSDYRPDSEIRQLAVRAARQETAKDDRRQDHPLGGFQPLSISRDLRSVLAAARRVGKLSGGAFDVSVSPLSQLWRKSKASGELPPADELASAKAVVGPQNWRLGEAGVTMKPGVAFDLGGIAKGYALDESLKALKASGVNVALIDGGGDLIAGDPPPGRETWRVGVAPLEAGGEPKWIIPLVNSAAATSGDAWQHLQIEGRRYSHVIDPKTGLGVEGRHSATVVAPTAMEADAWASALCVMGPKSGAEALASQAEVEAILTTVVEGQPVQTMTDGFKSLAVPRKSNARPPTGPARP